MNVFDDTLAFASDYSTGLTKRELFAAMAMQGLLADQSIDGTASRYAGFAVKCADALIEALNETKEKP